MRVLLTRPRAQAERSAARLAALGHEPLVAPLLAIRLTGAPLSEGPFDALIVTSANAAPALSGLDWTLPVFAVGERTAGAIRDAGFADVREAEGDAASLAALALRTLPANARLLHLAGRDRKAEPEASLAARGYSVETVVAYEAVAATALPEALARALRDGALDAALHYSRRSAETALALTRAADLADAFLSLRHFCLSQDAATPLREQPAARLIVAEEPKEASLFDALALVASPPGRRTPRPPARNGGRTGKSPQPPRPKSP